MPKLDAMMEIAVYGVAMLCLTLLVVTGHPAFEPTLQGMFVVIAARGIQAARSSGNTGAAGADKDKGEGK